MRGFFLWVLIKIPYYVLLIIINIGVQMGFFSSKILSARRKHILKHMKEDSIMVLNSNPIMYKNGTGEYLYHQNSNFYYLTGLDIDECRLLLAKTGGKTYELLFTKPNDPHISLWIGSRPEIDDLRAETGIKDVVYLKDFWPYFRSFADSPVSLYYEYTSGGPDKGTDCSLCDVNEIRSNFPHISSYIPLHSLLFKSRIIKDSEEIKALKKAIDITGKAVVRALKNTKPGMYEYEIRAEIEYEYLKSGSRMPAFNSIVAAGVNASVLHYVTLDSAVKKDDLILIDIGAEWNNYSADITRTYPASGKFTGKKKELYKALYDVQEKLIASCKPGTTLKQIDLKSKKLIGKLLKSFKYIKDESEYYKYYAHSIGHMLGLDTHDVQHTGKREQPILKKGMVLTIEPGIYIREENLGIRIEDDILITAKGYDNLSSGIPKSISEIEKTMRA